MTQWANVSASIKKELAAIKPINTMTTQPQITEADRKCFHEAIATYQLFTPKNSTQEKAACEAAAAAIAAHRVAASNAEANKRIAELEAQHKQELAALRRKLEWEIYRQLNEGEMTRVGDEYLDPDADDWKPHNDPSCNRPAPCPLYPAHVLYRRHVANELKTERDAAQQRAEAWKRVAGGMDAAFRKFSGETRAYALTQYDALAASEQASNQQEGKR